MGLAAHLGTVAAYTAVMEPVDMGAVVAAAQTVKVVVGTGTEIVGTVPTHRRATFTPMGTMTQRQRLEMLSACNSANT